MDTKARHIGLIALLLSATLAACRSTTAAGGGTTTPTIQQESLWTPDARDTEELEWMLVQEIVKDRERERRSNSPDGSIIAHVAGIKGKTRGQTLRVWRYEQSQTIEVGAGDLSRALGGNRSQWPPYTICFALTFETPTTVNVDVCTWYDMGIVEGSRGGNCGQWTLAKQDDQWSVIQRELEILAWD